MNTFSQKDEINTELFKKKKNSLRRERLLSIFKKRLKIFKYIPLIALLYYLFFLSPLFIIKNIETNNLKYIDGENIVSDFMILKGENFFLTDLTDLRTEVIKNYAFIESIYTEKLFPDRIIIHVREKEPFAVVSNEQGCYLLDRFGFVLLESDCGSLKSNYSVKEVVGQDLNNIEFMVNSQSNFYNIENIYKIIQVLDYYNYNVKTIALDGQRAEFILHDERVLIFSFVDDIEIQLKRFIIVNRKIEIENMSFESIDIRYQRPVLK